MEYPIIIDWLTVSGSSTSFDDLLKHIGLYEYKDHFKPCPGRNFYSYGITWDRQITIYRQQLKKGEIDYNATLIDITGRGCRLYESVGDLMILICWLRDHGWSCSRVDIAMDIIDNKFSISRLVKDTQLDNYVCRSKFRNIMDSVNDGIQAYSLYFGKQQSNIYINIYDKRAERGYSPEDMPNWTRIEIRLRHENALGFFHKLNYKNIGLLYSGILNNYLRFLQHSNDTNKARWKTAPYWQRILDTADKIKIAEQPGVVYDFAKYEDSFFTQCGSRIKAYLKLHDMADLCNEISLRDIQLNDKQLLYIENYQQGIDYLEVQHFDSERNRQAV